MENRRKLRHDLERYSALLPLTTGPQAIAALEELIRETSERLDQLDPLHRQGYPDDGGLLCKAGRVYPVAKLRSGHSQIDRD
jgi:hypothetical protein